MHLPGSHAQSDSSGEEATLVELLPYQKNKKGMKTRWNLAVNI